MVLVNGLPASNVSALDRGLAYGDGAFRTLRAEHGTLAHWPRHYRKLAHDCARLGITCPPEDVLAAEACAVAAGEAQCVVKLIVTRGAGGRGYAPPPQARATRIVARFAPPAAPIRCPAGGVRVRWCATRLAHQPALAGIKHLNRLENVLARGEWSAPEIAEGLMLDCEGHVVAGTMTNLFLVEGGKLVTPPLDRCGVAGVQRERALEILARERIACVIEPITPARLIAAEQVLLVNSVIGLWWVSALDDRSWAPAPLGARLAEWLAQRS